MASILAVVGGAAAAGAGTAAAGTAAAATAGTAAAATAATGLTFGSVMTGVGALATVASGYASMQSQKEASEYNQKQIELQGRFAAIQSNEELLKTLSSNNVAAASSGLMSSGSVARAQETAQRNAAEALEIQRLNTTQQAQQAGQNNGLLSMVGSTVTAGTRLAGALKTTTGT